MLKNIPKEELELLSYTDMTELILKEQKKSLNTPTIFRTICDLLGYSDEQYADKIGDYYTSLTTDKRFVFLDNNEWELREKHPVDIVVDEEDEDEESEEESTEDEEVEEETPEDEIDSVMEDDDDLDDLSIMTEEELEEED